VFKGNVHIDLNQPATILDSACGVGWYSSICVIITIEKTKNLFIVVGLWSLEMAHDYPKCQVIGIDVVPPSEKEGWNLTGNHIPSSAGQNEKLNIQFQYGDILQPTLMFPDNHFDLIYQRDVATVLPFQQWPNLITEFYRITKSGGQIQLVEYGKSIVL
jgi:ubiquinone/menaquinone biosynthesis C-methylase UbiE